MTLKFNIAHMAGLWGYSGSNLRKTSDSFMVSPEQVTTAIQTIDQLSSWLENAGLTQVAIAQFKFNSLAAIYPDLKEVAEIAKSLIGATFPITEEGMTVTELATIAIVDQFQGRAFLCHESMILRSLNGFRVIGVVQTNYLAECGCCDRITDNTIEIISENRCTLIFS